MPTVKIHNRLLVRGAVLLLSIALLACNAGEPGEVSRDQVAAWIGQAGAPLLLDVRSQQEFAGGHIPGSINIPVAELASRLGEIEAHKGSEVVVYCERGGRAVVATEILEAVNFSSIRHMEGDMSAWRKAQLPLE